jgi:integrase
VILGLAAGLRLAEVVALQWSDVDFATGKVSIVRSSWGPTKNGKKRSLTLPGSQVARPRRMKIEQAKSLLLRGVRQTERTTVCAKSDGTPMAHQTLAGAWTRYAKASGLEISFHGLRHSNTIPC